MPSIPALPARSSPPVPTFEEPWAVGQGHFTLAERPSKVGQNTLIGTLTASCALQERYQSA